MGPGFLLLALVSLVGAADVPECSLDSGKAVENLIQASLDIWAATKRCNADLFCDFDPCPMKMTCAQDIFGAVEGVTGAVQAVLDMAESCAGFKDRDPCGKAAGQLSGLLATLGKATTYVLGSCGKSIFKESGTYLADIQKSKPTRTMTGLGECTIGVEGATNSLFRLVNKAQKLKCPPGQPQKYCAYQVLDVVGLLGFMGNYLAKSIGQCGMIGPDGKPNFKDPEAVKRYGDSYCVQGVSSMVGSLSYISLASMTMADKCGAPKESGARLYLETDLEPASGSFMIALVAMLPFVAVLAFIGGVRFARSRQTREPVSQVELE